MDHELPVDLIEEPHLLWLRPPKLRVRWERSLALNPGERRPLRPVEWVEPAGSPGTLLPDPHKRLRKDHRGELRDLIRKHAASLLSVEGLVTWSGEPSQMPTHAPKEGYELLKEARAQAKRIFDIDLPDGLPRWRAYGGGLVGAKTTGEVVDLRVIQALAWEAVRCEIVSPPRAKLYKTDEYLESLVGNGYSPNMNPPPPLLFWRSQEVRDAERTIRKLIGQARKWRNRRGDSNEREGKRVKSLLKAYGPVYNQVRRGFPTPVKRALHAFRVGAGRVLAVYGPKAFRCNPDGSTLDSDVQWLTALAWSEELLQERGSRDTFWTDCAEFRGEEHTEKTLEEWDQLLYQRLRRAWSPKRAGERYDRWGAKDDERAQKEARQRAESEDS